MTETPEQPRAWLWACCLRAVRAEWALLFVFPPFTILPESSLHDLPRSERDLFSRQPASLQKAAMGRMPPTKQQLHLVIFRPKTSNSPNSLVIDTFKFYFFPLRMGCFQQLYEKDPFNREVVVTLLTRSREWSFFENGLFRDVFTGSLSGGGGLLPGITWCGHRVSGV